jgi:hypothetical protein
MGLMIVNAVRKACVDVRSDRNPFRSSHLRDGYFFLLGKIPMSLPVSPGLAAGVAAEVLAGARAPAAIFSACV